MYPRKNLNISLFSETVLVILVSVVTLLLQLISFATTWNGVKIYLENIFPYAALFFAVAIQSTNYFFVNSLRRKITILRLLALLTAMCCSVYFSYTGIYNSVNSPIIYLQENYIRIAKDLNRNYQEELDAILTRAQEIINDSSSHIITKYNTLLSEAENIDACHLALEDISLEYTSGMHAPKQSSYENYEDYAAAYQSYVNSISQGKNQETDALRTMTLSSYGFASMEALNEARQNNIASLNALTTAFGVTGNELLPEKLTAVTVQLTTAINNTATGSALHTGTILQLNRLLQAAKLCGYSPENPSQLTTSLNLCAEVSTTTLIADYATLVASLPGEVITDENTMTLKSAMDSEIMNAILRLNSILPEAKQLNYSAESYTITDLYLIPIQALLNENTRMTAYFSLLIATLIDTLSLLFAISLRRPKPLWARRTLIFNQMHDYEPLIFAALPNSESPMNTLQEFLDCFSASPQTEADGYMLRADICSIPNYHSLTALLCQINLAKIMPAGFFDNKNEETILLRTRFVFWANTMIFEESKNE